MSSFWKVSFHKVRSLLFNTFKLLLALPSYMMLPFNQDWWQMMEDVTEELEGMGRSDFTPDQWIKLRKITRAVRRRVNSATVADGTSLIDSVNDDKLMRQMTTLGRFYSFRSEVMNASRDDVSLAEECLSRWEVDRIMEIAKKSKFLEKFQEHMETSDEISKENIEAFFERQESYLLDSQTPGNTFVITFLRKLLNHKHQISQNGVLNKINSSQDNVNNDDNNNAAIDLVSPPRNKTPSGINMADGAGRSNDLRNYSIPSTRTSDTRRSQNPKKRRSFSSDEKDAILWGVQRHGHNWKEILNDPDFRSKLRNRSNVQIKDCYRTMQKKGEAPVVQGGHVAAKRRERVDFSAEENDAILNGVDRYRDGGYQIQWSKILDDPVYGSVLTARTTEAVRDHYRKNLVKCPPGLRNIY